MALGFSSNGYMVNTTTLNTAHVTQMCWLKPLSLVSVFGGIIGFMDGLGSPVLDKDLIALTTAPGYLLDYQVFDGGTKRVTGTTIIPLYEWTHVAATADGTNIRVFVNGREDGVLAAGNTYTGYASQNVFVAGHGTRTDTTTRYMHGLFAEAAVWTEALTEAQIRAIAARDVLPQEVEPASQSILWRLNRFGTNYDYFGSRNDGLMGPGTTIWVDQDPPQLRVVDANPAGFESDADEFVVPFGTIGGIGYEPDLVGPEQLDTPFATIGVNTFPPVVPALLIPPFMTVGFYAGPVQPGSETPGPPVPVEPVFVYEGALPPVVPPSLPPTIGGGSGGVIPPVGPGIPLPPLSSGGLAGIRFYQGPPWRWVVTDLETNTLTFLDRLALDATVTYGLNKGATAKLSVPSANPEVNILHDDGEPFVSEGNRLLYGFRREGGISEGHPELWRCRFAGKILQVEDHGELENAITYITAFDPWHLLYQRPMVNEDGDFPDKAGFFSFDDTQVGNIALIFLRNTILNHGISDPANGLGIDTGDGAFPGAEPGNLPGTEWWQGEYENSTQYDTKCEQGMMVGEVWDQQLATGAIDILMTPIYDPVNRPGYMVDLSIFEQAGEIKDDAVFAWDKPSRNLRGIDSLKDGTNRANTIRYYYGQGGPPSGGGIPLSYGPSQIKYGETWAQTFYAMRIDEIVNAVAQLQLDLMQDGVKTVNLTPAPERMPFLFTEFWLGDRVPVYASSNLRQEIVGYQRIYGCVLSIDENSYEQVPQLLVSPSDV